MRRLIHLLNIIIAYALLFITLIVVNVLQTASLILLPFSRRAFRAFNRFCADQWWGLGVIATERLCKIQPVFTGDEIPAKENAIIVSNHQQMPDIITLMCLARRKGRLGDLKWFVKDPIKYVPGVGWGMLFLDCLYVKRNWDRDEGKIRATFSKFLRDDIPIWLISFSEGTRITPSKLAKSNEFARKAGLCETRYVMTPRTKGFVASVHGLREHVDAVYDVTIGYPHNAIPTLWTFYSRPWRAFHLHVRRYPIDTLPMDPEELSRWILQRFQEKDQLLAQFHKTGRFPG